MLFPLSQLMCVAIMNAKDQVISRTKVHFHIILTAGEFNIKLLASGWAFQLCPHMMELQTILCLCRKTEGSESTLTSSLCGAMNPFSRVEFPKPKNLLLGSIFQHCYLGNYISNSNFWRHIQMTEMTGMEVDRNDKNGTCWSSVFFLIFSHLLSTSTVHIYMIHTYLYDVCI